MRILLVEDDKKLNESLAFQLEKNGFLVDTCQDGEEALYYIEENVPDLILLDRMLPFISGTQILDRMRQAHNETPVILITALGSLDDKVTGLDSGADDYLVKPFEYEELSARIRSLGRRSGKWEEDSLLQWGDVSYDCTLRILHGPKKRQQLSGKEGLLLEVFLRNAGQVIRRMVIFSRVWGVDAPVEESNLDTYIHFLRKQLRYVGSSLSVKTVRGIGYVLEGPGEEGEHVS